MSPPDREPLDAEFIDLLVAYDEALASGQDPTPLADPSTPALTGKLRQTQDLLDRIERDRRAETRSGGSGPSVACSAPTYTSQPDPVTAPQFGRFRLVRELGRGGGGIVFLAFDPVLGREVALKVPRPEALLSVDARRRFLREAQAAGSLDHPNLVQVHEVGEEGPFCYIVSAYCPGPTLRRWLDEQSQPLPPAEAAQLIATLADAVAYMHGRGILHRDLKPSNILLQGVGNRESGVGKQGTANNLTDPHPGSPSAPCSLFPTPHSLFPKITDFGLAKLVESDGDSTRSGALLGTPGYMAPEQAEGRLADVGPATDVHALGLLLYEVLTRCLPYHGSSEADTLRRIVADEPVSPRRMYRKIPRDLEAICLKCLEKRPERRYPTAAALAEDLRRFQKGEPTVARPLTVGQRTVKWARRRPVAASLLGVVTLGILAFAVGLVWHYREVRGYDHAMSAAEEREQARAGQAEKAREQVYGDQMALIGSHWKETEPSELAKLLGRLRPGPKQRDLRGFEWWYLWHQSRRIRHLEGHQAFPVALAFSRDGKGLTSVDHIGVFKEWDVGTGRPLADRAAQDRDGHAQAVSPDGRRVVSYTRSAMGIDALVVRDLDTGQTWRTQLPLPTEPWFGFSPDGQQVTCILELHLRPMEVHVWDLRTAEDRLLWRKPGRRAHGVWLSPDGQTLVVVHYAEGSASSPITIDAIDVRTGQERSQVQVQQDFKCAIALSPDGQTLATGNRQGEVILWDARSGTERRRLPPLQRVMTMAFSADGSLLAVGEAVDTISQVSVWNVADVALQSERLEVAGNVMALAFGTENKTLAVVSRHSGSVRLWEWGGFTSLSAHSPQQAWAVAFTPDGRTLVSGGDDHRVILWNAVTGQKRRAMKDHESLVTSVAVSPDGKYAASASYDGKVKLWDSGTGDLRATLTADERLRSLALSPDSKVLAAGIRTHSPCPLRLWQIDTGLELPGLTDLDSNVRSVAFSPNGKLLASASGEGKIRLWDTRTWQLHRRIDDSAQVGCLAFAPDGKTLASGNMGGVVRVWDVATGKEVVLMQGHIKEVYAVAFSPDGRTLASAGDDKTVRLWQAATGQELLVLKGHTTRVNAVAFAPDGRTLASASHDGEIKLWRCPPATEKLVPDRKEHGK